LNLNLALEALKSEGKTRTLARPEIVTVENNKASIALGEEIPYATVSSAGTQIQFKEAVLKLEDHYFSLATLGVALVVQLVAVNWDTLTGGLNGFSGIPLYTTMTDVVVVAALAIFVAMVWDFNLNRRFNLMHVLQLHTILPPFPHFFDIYGR